MRNFVKIKPSRNGKITLSFIDIGKSCLRRKFFHITKMSFNAIRENKILAKISESTIGMLSQGCTNCFVSFAFVTFLFVCFVVYDRFFFVSFQF